MQSEIQDYSRDGGGITEKAQDPLKVAKNFYKLVMENDRVRVLEVQLGPCDKAIMHYHPDHVVYVLEIDRSILDFPPPVLKEW